MSRSRAIACARAVSAVLCAALASACGGGGGGGAAAAPVAPAAVVATTQTLFANSVAPGAVAPLGVVYSAAGTTTLASVAMPVASALLPAGTTAIVAEHRDTGLPNLLVACISGNGESTNLVTQINLGVVAESAAVLLGAGWSAVDAPAAWSRAVAAGTAWSGWENCGVKPEGLPSRSSVLTPTADGGYQEDVYNGNPGTTFVAIHRVVTPTQVQALLSNAGQASADLPSRPLVLQLRAYADTAGHTVFIQTGVPQASAAAGVRGFIALYQPA